MTTARIVLPTPHPGQRQVIQESRRYNVLCMGRRWGKSQLGIDRLIGPALEGYPVAWYAPEDKYFTEIWVDLLRFLKPVIQYKNTNDHRLELAGGGIVEVWNMARPKTVSRGRKYKRVCIDEAAQIADLSTAWEQSIRATLIDFVGDAYFFSTPLGFNFFYNLFDKGVRADKILAEAALLGETFDAEQMEMQNLNWKCWQFPSATNPHLPASEIAALAKDLTPKNYSQEILAQFMGEGTAVFPNVADQAKGIKRAYIPSHQYAIGVDWGRDNDFTVFTVIDITTLSIVWIEVTSRIEFHHQRSRLMGVMDRYHPIAVLCEMNSIGVPNFEELQRAGLPVVAFWATNVSKLMAVDALVLALSRRQLTLLDKEQIVDEVPVGQQCINQLHAYAASKLPSGQTRYAAPTGIHDDYVVSIMLAWLCAIRPDMQAFRDDQVRQSLSDEQSWPL